MRVSWIARKSNQSILKEVNPKCSLEELLLKLRFQYVGYLMRKADSLEKTLMLRKIEGNRRKGQQKMIGWYHQINGHEFWQTPGYRRTGKPGILQAMGSQRVGHDLATEQQ